jgi:hypothetical protein
MWSPVEIFALIFFLNHSPMANERLSVKETIEVREIKVITENIGLRNDI